MELTGNVVTPEEVFFGRVGWENGLISFVEKKEPFRKDAEWILAGFIDLHLHGLGEYGTETADDLRGLARYAAEKGTTGVCPTFSSASRDFMLKQLETTRRLAGAEEDGAKILGSHLEGPWLSVPHKGGMVGAMLHDPDPAEAREYLAAAEGTLRLLTIAPELPGALDVIRELVAADVSVSAGHTGCPPEFFDEAVRAGVSQLCHLFDTYDCPAAPEGVRSPALTDMALIDDRVMKEIIMDGLHVPPELVILSRRAAGADHIIAVTDALIGAGLPYARIRDNGRWYVMREGEVGRLEENGTIVGSSLSMNRAFFNMTARFGFSPVEASKALSANPARQMKVSDRTGVLKTGFAADIAVLAPDGLTVDACFVEGKKQYER